MLDLVGREDGEVKYFDGSKPLKDAVLEFAVRQRGAAALIDAGATMAGLSNREVAERVLALLPNDGPSSKGVVYFEVSEDKWFVLSRSGNNWPKAISPIHESDCFVYFDDSHCRGADMKLSPDATAVLTIGPGMCKDKIMQAAGRLRKLMYQQKLVLAVPSELESKIHAANHHSSALPLSLQILHWVMHNTVQDTKEGLAEWGVQGSHFATTQHPKARLVDERLELSDLYAEATMEQTVHHVILMQQGRDMGRIKKLGIEITSMAQSMMERVAQHVNQYGSDVQTLTSQLDEECERELENEKELEREVERQLPRQAPRTPQTWDFHEVLEATTPLSLPIAAGVMPLEQALLKYCGETPELQAIDWAQCGIFATRNYFETVTTREGGEVRDLCEYLRPVEAVLLFANGKQVQCLLVSEWEADKILGLMWRNSNKHHCFFANLAYQGSFDLEGEPKGLLTVPQISVPALGVDRMAWMRMLVGLELLAGNTTFPTEKQKEAVQALLPTGKAKRGALALVAMRGRQHTIPRSDLEEICAVDIGEA